MSLPEKYLSLQDAAAATAYSVEPCYDFDTSLPTAYKLAPMLSSSPVKESSSEWI
jgi:hypothetical protein